MVHKVDYYDTVIEHRVVSGEGLGSTKAINIFVSTVDNFVCYNVVGGSSENADTFLKFRDAVTCYNSR